MIRKYYDVKMPTEIIMGDPYYFEEFEDDNKKLKSLISIIKPTKKQRETWKCGVSLLAEKKHNDEYNIDFDNNRIIIAIAPKKYLRMYLNEKHFTDQNVETKKIGVDTAEYIISVDDKSDIIRTDGDGYWATEIIFRAKGKRIVEAIMLDISMPSELTLENIEKYINYFFEVETSN